MLLRFVGKGSPFTPLTAKEKENFEMMAENATVDDEKAKKKAEKMENLRQKILAIGRMQRIYANLR